MFQAQIGPKVASPISTHNSTWEGVRMRSATHPYVAQFSRDGLIFSRLRPYENWDSFILEARRLWEVFVELGSPSEIQRLDVRFVNRIPTASFATLKEYLKEVPSFVSDLSLNGFLYQSNFDVPEHPLGIGIVKTMQPTVGEHSKTSGLIIDIDVFSKRPMLCEAQPLDEILPKMRWLKNYVFFSLLTENAVANFK